MTNRSTKELAIDILEKLGELKVNQYHSVYQEMGLDKIQEKAEQILENELQKLTEIPKNTLWQYLEKEHLDPENEITDEQWIEFVNDYEDSFADKVSQLGNEYLAYWKAEQNVQKRIFKIHNSNQQNLRKIQTKTLQGLSKNHNFK